MKQKLHKQQTLFFRLKKWTLAAIALLSFHTINAADWYVNDGSITGDVFTTGIGNDANAGTAGAPFATIQFAINTAASGDTIYVDAGIYTSATDSITISKPLTLRGAKFGIPAGPAAVPVNRGTDEAIITATVYYGPSQDNITFDGFTVNTGLLLRGIQARGLNSVIINNIVTGIVTMPVQQAGISARANAPNRIHSYVISNNNVTGFRFGIYFDGNTENTSVISLNYVADCGGTGIILTASEGHQATANLIENNLNGMEVTRGNNIINQNTIRGNTFLGIRLAGTAFSSGNMIMNNFFENNGAAISLTDPNPASVNNQAHFNSFTGNSFNIANTHTANFDATCNWFNSIVPAVIAAQISGNVTFVPFLTDGIDTDLTTPGFQPTTTCVVPVILTTFTASVKNYNVLLNWQTSTEINSSHYIVEKSSDNQNFIAVGRVEAKGFSDVNVNYKFTDEKPYWFDRPVYYRLAMIDRDGAKKYSKIIPVILKATGSYVQSVYPNPVKSGSLLHTGFISGMSQTINVSIINGVGQVLQRADISVTKGINQVEIPVAAGISGTYFLLVKSVDKVQQVPVLIY